MGLETGGPNSLPKDLNVEWPLATDPLNKGDDHIRLVKTTLVNFWNMYHDEATNKAKVSVIPPAVNSDQVGAGFGGFRYQIITNEDDTKTLRLFTT